MKPFRFLPRLARPRSFRSIAILAWLSGLLLSSPARSEAAHANLIELDNQVISPVTQRYIFEAIERSESDGAVCLILQLDTPGGLLEATRAIVKRIMNAKVPIAVYVAPSGSRAGSAGVFITLAAHVAAMAPSTTIGAAHPVTVGEGGSATHRLVRRTTRTIPESTTEKKAKSDASPHAERAEHTEEEVVVEDETDPMSEKIVNDTVAWITAIAKTRGRNEAWAAKAVAESFSVTEVEAVKERIVDLVATDVPDLLRQMDGRTVQLDHQPVALATKDATIVTVPMSGRQRFLSVITHPNIAYLLMMLGTLGLIVELTHPGMALPGVAGVICLLLALYAFQALPVSYVALAFIVLGLALLIAELKLASHGLLAGGGIIALTFGSLMLFESPDPTLRVSLHVVVPMVSTLAGIILFVVQRALRAQAQPVVTGAQGLVGTLGTATTPVHAEGKVFLHGELWDATSPRLIRRGEQVRVLKVEGLRLLVDKAEQKEGR